MHYLTWSGGKFREVPIAYQPPFADGGRIAPGERDIESLDAPTRARLTALMATNPPVAAFIVPTYEVFGFAECWHHIVPELFPPAMHRFSDVGFAGTRGDSMRRDMILVQLREDYVDTLAHELFHPIGRNLPDADWQAVNDFGDEIREANNDNLFIHRDWMRADWLARDEEAEAVAFARFATGVPQPFGLLLPKRVVSIFRAALAGRFAHGRVSTWRD